MTAKILDHCMTVFRTYFKSSFWSEEFILPGSQHWSHWKLSKQNRIIRSWKINKYMSAWWVHGQYVQRDKIERKENMDCGIMLIYDNHTNQKQNNTEYYSFFHHITEEEYSDLVRKRFRRKCTLQHKRRINFTQSKERTLVNCKLRKLSGRF